MRVALSANAPSLSSKDFAVTIDGTSFTMILTQSRTTFSILLMKFARKSFYSATMLMDSG